VVAAALGIVMFAGSRPARSARPDLFPRRGFFQRVATYDVSGSVAEIAAATPDGRTLIYTDSEEQELGFVDGWRLEEADGLAILPNGRLLVTNDNNGVGETRLLETPGP